MSEGRALRGGAAVLVGMLAAGLWLHAPSLDFAFSVDDMLHVAELAGHAPLPERSALSLYVFADGATDPMGALQGSYLPWWTADDLRVAFLRPLSSLTHGIDHALYGASPRGFHATNLLLWGLVLLAVGAFYLDLARDSGRSAVAPALAGAIFALDSAHIDNVVWIAGRYTLVTAFFAVLALRRYHRFRRDDDARSRWIALALTLAALLASEAAFALALWFAAYELCVSRSPWGERARALLPFAVLMAGYLVVYKLTGHGTASSSMYVDPVDDPVRFLSHMSRVAPVSLGTVLTSADWNLALLKAGLGLLAPLAIVIALAPHLLRDRLSAFVFLGAVLGILPQSASSVREYALLLPSIGVAWVYGSFVADTARDVGTAIRRRGDAPTPSAPRRAAALGGGAVRVAASAAIVWLSLWDDPRKAVQELVPERGAIADLRIAVSESAELPPDDVAADARVLLLTSPDPSMAIYLPIYRVAMGHPWPGGTWPLSISTAPHLLTRTGRDSFSLTQKSRSGFLHSGFAGMFNDAFDYPVGERFRVGALEVEVLETFRRGAESGDRVKTIGVTLDRPIDDPSVWLLAWDGERWARVAPPRVGGSRPIPRQRSGLAPPADAGAG